MNVAMFWPTLHFLQIRESVKDIWSSALVIQNNLFSCYLLTGGLYNDKVELNTLCALQTNTWLLVRLPWFSFYCSVSCRAKSLQLAGATKRKKVFWLFQISRGTVWSVFGNVWSLEMFSRRFRCLFSSLWKALHEERARGSAPSVTCTGGLGDRGSGWASIGWGGFQSRTRPRPGQRGGRETACVRKLCPPRQQAPGASYRECRTSLLSVVMESCLEGWSLKQRINDIENALNIINFVINMQIWKLYTLRCSFL